MAEAERKPTRRREWITVGLVTVVALTVRLVGIGWGLPNKQHYFSYHPDEIFLLLPSFGFAQGDWNPHFFNYGTLYIYLVGLPAVLFGIVPQSAPFPQGLAPLYLTGRIITAVLGTATVPLLYLALKRESRSLAYDSVMMLAICPLHVINSHYATVDVPATFLIVLAFLFALRGAGEPRLRWAILAGLAVGFAAATKYNAGLFLAPMLLAPVLSGRKRGGITWWLGVPAAAAVGFLVCNPWVGAPEFRRDFLFEWRHAQAGGTLAFVGTGSGWSYHLLHGLPVALGYGLMALFGVGLLLALRAKSPAVRLSFVWLIFYFAVIGFSKERFIRYLVPMMPFVCVIAALPIERLMRWVGKPRGWKFELAGMAYTTVLTPTLLYLLFSSIPFIGGDVRDQVWEDVRTIDRIRQSVRPLAAERRVGLVQAPWYYHPPVSPYNAGAFSRSMFEEWNRSERDRVVITGWDADLLRLTRPKLFFVSDLESRDPLRLGNQQAASFMDALNDLYGPQDYGMLPDPGARDVERLFSWFAPPRSWAPPDWLYPQPIITVYYARRP